MSKNKSIFRQSWAGTCIRTDAVKTPELLIGYFIGPFGAMLSSGIFTSFLQAYLGDVLGLNAGFLSVLQLVRYSDSWPHGSAFVVQHLRMLSAFL